MGTKNKLTDLNNHLFEQLERLNDDKLTGKKLEEEIRRGKAMTDVAQAIVNSSKTIIDAAKLLEKGGTGKKELGGILALSDKIE